MDSDKVAREIHKTAPGARIVFDGSMSELTSLRIGGPADVIVMPSTEDEAAGVLEIFEGMSADIMALGGGTNLLVRDGGIRGAVLHMAPLSMLDVVSDTGGEVVVRAGAGLPMNRLLGLMRREGFSGLEGLSGIPGYVGGAIAGNAGSFGCEMLEAVREISIIVSGEGRRVLKKGEFSQGYRSCGLPDGAVISSALIALRRDERKAVATRMDEALMRKNQTQPLGRRSAGCVFKNPPGDSAGRLVDVAGCKGMSEGGVEVSHVHAGFFINQGGGSAADFMRLMEKVHARVMDVFAVDLEPEIKVVGSDA